MLLIDEDDLYWMSHLHNSLYALGFSCGEGEMEDWIFGEGTREAIFTYQASANLPETGLCSSICGSDGPSLLPLKTVSL